VAAVSRRSAAALAAAAVGAFAGAAAADGANRCCFRVEASSSGSVRVDLERDAADRATGWIEHEWAWEAVGLYAFREPRGAPPLLDPVGPPARYRFRHRAASDLARAGEPRFGPCSYELAEPAAEGVWASGGLDDVFVALGRRADAPVLALDAGDLAPADPAACGHGVGPEAYELESVFGRNVESESAFVLDRPALRRFRSARRIQADLGFSATQGGAAAGAGSARVVFTWFPARRLRAEGARLAALPHGAP
jgi:hypothetical protein